MEIEFLFLNTPVLLFFKNKIVFRIGEKNILIKNKKIAPIDIYTSTTRPGTITVSGNIEFNSFFIRVYKIGRLVNFYMKGSITPSTATWKFYIDKYRFNDNTCYGNVYSAFKGTGTLVAAYGTSDGYIAVQTGTGSNMNFEISGTYISVS